MIGKIAFSAFFVGITAFFVYVGMNVYEVIRPCENPQHVLGQTFYSCPTSKSEVMYLIKDMEDFYGEIQAHHIELDPTKELVAFDIGGNIGMFTVYFMKAFPKSKMFTYEPMPQTFGNLKKNMEYHKLTKNVKYYNKGMGLKVEEVIFKHFPDLPADSTMIHRDMDAVKAGILSRLPKVFYDTGNYVMYYLFTLPVIKNVGKFIFDSKLKLEGVDVKAKLTTLSVEIEKHDIKHIDLLKIDVEGAEVNVMKGMKDEYWEMVDNVVMEVHHECFEKGGEIELTDGNMKYIDERLRELGFDNISWVDQGLELFEAGWTDNYFRGPWMMYASRDRDD